MLAILCHIGWHRWSAWTPDELVLGGKAAHVQRRSCARCGRAAFASLFHECPHDWSAWQTIARGDVLVLDAHVGSFVTQERRCRLCSLSELRMDKQTLHECGTQR